ncbi:hypothetical protein, partial [Thermus scotoductus]|uniref:hypothetical protein n=1 Tax=Thermus scotoductus TaxID=37636 RepID=UPI001C12ACFC
MKEVYIVSAARTPIGRVPYPHLTLPRIGRLSIRRCPRHTKKKKLTHHAPSKQHNTYTTKTQTK